MSDPSTVSGTSEPIVRLAAVGKMYKVFGSRGDKVIDALGLERLMFWRVVRAREFWALRGIDLELRPGERVGVIGRNGAGKTTLLKLLTGNLAPTEGRLEIRGSVQPLIEIGAGFHPEFTGHENIHASLTYQGLSRAEVREAEGDIAEFTELGAFLGQPIKTYSLGMLARLAFATATAVKPEILVIDEVLGAGDAYFVARSAERIRALVESGASVILVSHALDQITRLCDRAVWLERGRVVMRGASLEVVKAYQEFMQRLEDRRLRAKNRKVISGKYSAEESDNTVDTIVVRFTVSGAPGTCEVDRVTLRRDGVVEDHVDVGSPQDVDRNQSAFVITEGEVWSSPEGTDRGLCRKIVTRRDGESGTAAVAFGLYLFLPDAEYEVEVAYRSHGACRLALDVRMADSARAASEMPQTHGSWSVHRVSLKGAGRDSTREGADQRVATRTVRRWPGEGSLIIEGARLLGAAGEEQAVFQVGTPMRLEFTYRARRSGVFDVLPAVTLYRLDGILVSNHVGVSRPVTLGEGEQRRIRLDFGPLNLGNGNYVFSIALYRRLSELESDWYDLIAHSYEFQVVGNGRFENGIFHHAATWQAG